MDNIEKLVWYQYIADGSTKNVEKNMKFQTNEIFVVIIMLVPLDTWNINDISPIYADISNLT